jgi:diketogulonate reductase-like aldo/keto reductase
MEYITLSNGVKMPQLGYGVYQVSPEEAERCVSDAISVGYRMVDTAQAYANEEGVGNAVKKSGIARDEVFIVSKIWISNYGYEKAKASIDESLRKLQTEYIDLMLLHQPFCDRYGAYRALEEAYRAGKLRSIGVSNFCPDHFIDLASNVEVRPMVNQVETHVFNQQKQPQKYMEELGCQIMSWGPLAEGRNGFFTNELLGEIGKRYGKTIPQVALRWLLQRGVIIIPKSTHKERMAENFNIFDFELSPNEMARIESLDTNQSLFFDHHDGEVTKMFMGWRSLV